MLTPVVTKDLKKSKPQESSGSILFYAGGIYCCYLLYGYFQEYLLKEGRFGPEQERFSYNTFLLFVQGLFNLLCAYIAIRANGEPLRDKVPRYSYAISAFTQLAAMSFSFFALNYVDYPTQALAKACKPIPVMIMGLLVFGKKYHWSKYFTVAMITGGISVFMKEQDKSEILHGHSHNYFGYLMLLCSLALDGITGPIQDRLVSKHNPTANHLMFYSNLWSSLFSLISLVIVGEHLPAITFIFRNKEVIYYIVGQSLASALGQLFIYRLVKSFGSLTLSIVTTSRKFFSILFSVVYFGHELTLLQWTSVLAVFIGLAFDMIAPKGHSSQQQQHAKHDHHDHHHQETVHQKKTSNNHIQHTQPRRVAVKTFENSVLHDQKPKKTFKRN